MGFDRLGEMNGYWVLSNIRIEISRLPARDDEITLRTWPSGYSRTIATREFVGKDQNDSELFRAGSEWMVLNKQTNRLKNLSLCRGHPARDSRAGRPRHLFRLDLNLPKTGAKALPDKLNRLEPNNGYSQVDRARVPRSSIDLNGHRDQRFFNGSFPVPLLVQGFLLRPFRSAYCVLRSSSQNA